MISWLLGGSTALGLAGVVVLAVYALRAVTKMSACARTDSREISRLTEALAAARIEVAAHERTISDLSDVLGQKEDEIRRERAAQKELSDALDRTTDELSRAGTTPAALASLRASLDRLRRMSEVPGVPAATGDEDTDRVHGPTAGEDLKPRGAGGPA